jgi:hypothetical protein
MADATSSTLPDRPEYMLTTYDNPFDPFTQWDEWFVWDQRAGYHTPGLLDRIATTSDELSDADQHLAIQQAIEEIVRENVTGVHRKVKKGDVARIAEELASEGRTIALPSDDS